MYNYKATLVRVLDGDTIVCDIDLGFYMTARMPVRLAGINAPELNQTGGVAAKNHLHTLLGNHPLLLKTYKPRDKYGRYLAWVIIESLGLSVNERMIEDGHATEYGGVGI